MQCLGNLVECTEWFTFLVPRSLCVFLLTACILHDDCNGCALNLSHPCLRSSPSCSVSCVSLCNGTEIALYNRPVIRKPLIASLGIHGDIPTKSNAHLFSGCQGNSGLVARTVCSSASSQVSKDRVSSSRGVDEVRYSRQLLVLGHTAQQRIGKASVLVVGLEGAGLEAAKNLVLSGVGRVTLCDSSSVCLGDLSAGHCWTEEHVLCHATRASVARRKLQSLNPQAVVDVSSKASLRNAKFLKSYDAILLSNVTLKDQLCMSDLVSSDSRSENTGRPKIVCVSSRGVFGSIFNDFGGDFLVEVPSDDEPRVTRITGITRGHPTIFHTDPEYDASSSRRRRADSFPASPPRSHDLHSGDLVRIGGTELNTQMSAIGESVLRVAVLNPSQFTSNIDSSSWEEYGGGAYVKKLKRPAEISFHPLRAALAAPQIVPGNFGNVERQASLHACFVALENFRQRLNRLPFPGIDSPDHAVFLDIARKLDPAVSTATVEKFCCTCSGNIAPVASIMGGIAAQEVIKAVSKVFTPIRQFFYLDASECLPSKLPSASECGLAGSRYDGQIRVFGKQFQQKLSELNVFVVGAGAIGCEWLKLLALLGVAAPFEPHTFPSSFRLVCRVLRKWLLPVWHFVMRLLGFRWLSRCHDSNDRTGCVYVTDMDRIERSNLSRQFLFREKDLHLLKSDVAAAAARNINPSLRIVAYSAEVGPETSDALDDVFWDQLCVVCAALDNLGARVYIDQQCVYYRKPLIDSGTAGTKGNVQVVVPGLSESYASSVDPPEDSIPLCTVKHFPTMIEHTVQWARDIFQKVFHDDVVWIRRFFIAPEAMLEELLNLDVDTALAVLQLVYESVEDLQAINKADRCIAWARTQFDNLFVNPIRDLRSSGDTEFLDTCKRYGTPKPVLFDANHSNHISFLMCAAQLRCLGMFGASLDVVDKLSKEPVYTVHIPSDQPCHPNNRRRGYDKRDNRRNNSVYDMLLRFSASFILTKIDRCQFYDVATKQQLREQVHRWIRGIQNFFDNQHEIGKELRGAAGERLIEKLPEPFVFNKNEDTKNHVDFVVASANLRAQTYNIPTASRARIQQIVGRIIAALATTTSVVAGLAALELYKLAQFGFACSDQSHLNIKSRQKCPLGKATSGKDLSEAHRISLGSIRMRDKHKLEKFKNSFVNLALPLFASSTPVFSPMSIIRGGALSGCEYTIWDTADIEADKDLVVWELIELLQRHLGIQVEMITCGDAVIYSSLDIAGVPEEQLRVMNMTITERLKGVSQTAGHKFPVGRQKYASLNVFGIDSKDLGEVELPPVRYRFDFCKQRQTI
eukprot:GHVQ01038698.1.p1 GENE.GHVQ01038698.1~~GHVQ01038698.1.p1  ORF type:complete len:1312 (+),score=137.52 GHVQ01038698.1:60-3995(+)